MNTKVLFLLFYRMSVTYSPGGSQSIFINDDGRVGILTNSVDTTNAITVRGGINCSSLTLPNATFTGNYSELGSIPLILFSNMGTTTNRIKQWVGTAQTNASGQVTFYPTSNNASSGTAIFGNIINVNSSAWSNTATANSVPNVAGKTISSDLTTVTLNVTQGSVVGLGGSSNQFVGSGVNVMCMITGT